MSIGDALFDELIHERFDLLRGRLLQTARGALHGVRQADNGALFRLGLRSAVAKTLLTHVGDVILAQLHDFAASTRVFMLLQGALIKVTDERGAVMFLNDVNDALIESVLQGKIDPFFDVRDDD